MSDLENKPIGQNVVKPYLGFIDTNVLFKKPVSCLYAIVSLLLPIYALSTFIQFGIFKSEMANLIIASVLIVLVLAFAGIFGALIWWVRRITRDEGPKWYDNFRRFIQTLGEWLGTVIAIGVFGIVLILVIFLADEYSMVTYALGLPTSDISILTAFYGPICGFIIIIATKILLFLLDPLMWLIKQIWSLIVRLVLFFYRCTIGVGGTLEKNTKVWVAVTWILAIGVVVTSLVLCFKFGGLAPAIALTASLAFMGYLFFKRKHDEK